METKENTFRDKHIANLQKLFDLCDYIYKKALILKVMNIALTEEDEHLIAVAKDIKINMKDEIDIINNDPQHYDRYDRDYERYEFDCPKCGSELKVVEFTKNELGHEYNVNKCANCGIKFQDNYPNKIEHVKIFFENHYKEFDLRINNKKLKKEEIKVLSDRKIQLKVAGDRFIEKIENLIKAREHSKKSLIDFMLANDGMYESLLIHKHRFDREIGEA